MWASKDDVMLLNDPWRVLNKQKKYSDNFVPVNKAFVVLAVERYLSQPSDNSNPEDLYDVTLTDGSEGAKCLLQPRFNSMVYKNVMTAGCELKVNRISTVYEGKTLRVVLNKVYVVSRLSMYFQLCHPQHDFEDVAGDIRVVAGVNKHYLPLWNDVDYYGLQWRDNVQRNIKTISEHVITLAELEKTVEYKSSLPALLVRVMFKSTLWHNGKYSSTQEWAYQAMENAWKLSTGSRDGNSTELSDEVGSYFGTRPTSDTDSLHTSYYSFSELDKEECSSPQHTLSSTQDSEYYSAQEDLSQKHALDVVCLSPACLPNNRVYDTDTPLYTSPAAQILGTPTSGYRELFTTYSEPDHIMKTATTLEDKNLFFLLDLYSHGGGKVEVIVNRVFIESYN